MIMVVNNQFELGSIVYLKTDLLQLPRIITGIQICADGGMLYKCAQGQDVDWHYEVELSENVDIVLKTSN
jgi:hypothetical protein